MLMDSKDSRTSASGPIPQPDAPRRRLANFLEAFMEYTDGIPSPEVLRKWSAIACLSGAMRRKLKVALSTGEMYPNTIILLVSPPGVGKSQAIGVVHDLWTATAQFNVAPSSITKASLIDVVKRGHKGEAINGAQLDQFHSALIAAPEFGVLVPSYEHVFMNTINDLYDCGPIFVEATRKHGEITIDNPHISILSGTQPKYLAETFPEAAFGLGFTSRIMMVWAPFPVRISLFGKISKPQSLRKDLIHDLRLISQMRGEFQWSPDAAGLLDEWHMGGMEPVPEHHKLLSYNTRRPAHAIKLCMIMSIAESNDLIIERHHVEQARDLMLSAELEMPDIFKSMVSKSNTDDFEEVWHFVWREANRRKVKFVPEHSVIQFLASRVPANMVSYVLETMVKSGMLKHFEEISLPPGQRRFVAGQKLSPGEYGQEG